MKRYWLIRYRNLIGLNQDQAADNIGISRPYYNQIENGKRNPSGMIALKIATFYGFDMSMFFIESCCEGQHLKGEEMFANK